MNDSDLFNHWLMKKIDRPHFTVYDHGLCTKWRQCNFCYFLIYGIEQLQ